MLNSLGRVSLASKRSKSYILWITFSCAYNGTDPHKWISRDARNNSGKKQIFRWFITCIVCVCVAQQIILILRFSNCHSRAIQIYIVIAWTISNVIYFCFVFISESVGSRCSSAYLFSSMYGTCILLYVCFKNNNNKNGGGRIEKKKTSIQFMQQWNWCNNRNAQSG